MYSPLLQFLASSWQWWYSVSKSTADTMTYASSVKRKHMFFCDELSKYRYPLCIHLSVLSHAHLRPKAETCQAVWRFFPWVPFSWMRLGLPSIFSSTSDTSPSCESVLRHGTSHKKVLQLKPSHEYGASQPFHGMSSISCHVSIPCSFEATLRLTMKPTYLIFFFAE